MMRIIFWQFIPGLALLALQNVLAVRLHSVVLFCDVLMIFLALHIFLARDNQWLFASAFMLGFIAGIWSGRMLGFDALLYGALAFALHDVRRVVLMHVLSFCVFVLSLFVIKCFYYISVGFLLKQGSLYAFAMSISFLYMSFLSMGIAIILYVIIHVLPSHVK